MIEQSGQVVRQEGQFAWVRTERASSCSSCASGGCGTGALTRFFAAKPHDVRADNRLGAEVGENVIIGVSEEVLLRGSAFVYLLPLIAMMLGGLFLQSMAPQWGLAPGDGPAIVGGLLGLAGGFAWLFRHNRRIADDPRYHAQVLRRLGAPERRVDFIRPAGGGRTDR